MVTISHPNHPLFGQQVEIIRIRRGADPDLIIRLPDGLHTAIAMSWTDYVANVELEPLSTPNHWLDFIGLRKAAQLIELIRQERRDPKLDGENPLHTPESRL